MRKSSYPKFQSRISDQTRAMTSHRWSLIFWCTMMVATAAATPVDSSIAHKHNVVVNKFHVLQSKIGSEPSTFRVPRSLSLSLASNQCCSCIVYPKQAKSVEVSALVPSNNTQSVELYCDGIYVRQFEFQNDTVLRVKLLPLKPRRLQVWTTTME